MAEPDTRDRKATTIIQIRDSAPLAILIVSAIGLLYLWIGAKEAFGTLSFPFQVVGAVILFSGFVIIAAAFAIWRFQRLALSVEKVKDSEARQKAIGTVGLAVEKVKDSEARQKAIVIYGNVGLVGIITAAVLSAILLIVQLTIGEPTPWIFVWPIIVLATGFTFTRATNAGMQLPDMRKVVGILSISLLISAASVAYSDFYLPSLASPFLSVSIHVRKASVDKTKDIATIPISITLRNSQRVGVYVLAAYYDVAGRRQSVSRRSLSMTTEDAAAYHDQPIRRFAIEKSYDLLLEGPIGSSVTGSFLNPGEVQTIRDTVKIPVRTSYDAIQVSYQMLIMRNDKLQLDPSFYSSRSTPSWDESGHNQTTAPNWVLGGLPKNTHYIKWNGKVLYNNYLTQLLHGPQVINIWYLLPSPHSSYPYIPSIAGDITDAGTASQGLSSQQAQSLLNRYGMQYSYGSYDTVTMAELHIPTKG